jgi:CubicO group peptidase (beta-lactamase class C family)
MVMLKKIGLWWCLLSMGHAASAASLPQERAVAEQLDRVVARAIADQRIVGAVVVVARNGKILYHKAAGFADRENRRPMRTDTVFRLASMTKPLVAVAALRLVDQGLLGLDDPVTKWLPDFRPRTADGRVPTITLRHLLTHTSGLNYGFLEAKEGPYHHLGVSDGLDETGRSLDENLSRLSRAPLLFAPGTSWQYSLAIDVLGRVIEKATGLDLASALRKLVTGPLSMNDTEFTASHPERLATPYADAKPAPVRMTPLHRLPFGLSTLDFSPARALNRNAYPSGGAGMVGTAADYVRFLEAVRTGDPAILKPETDRALFESGPGTRSIPGGEPGWGWALMSAILVDPQAAKSPQSKGTIAWGGVYGTAWWVDRAAGLTVVILTNTAVEGMSGSFPAEVKQAVYGVSL